MTETKTSVETFGITPIIEDKDQLKQIIFYFGPNVFIDKPKKDPTNMFKFINETFIDTNFFYDGQLVLDLPVTIHVASEVKDKPPTKEELQANEKLQEKY